jgi:spore coat polysaccharide biosynthesis protein SpsF
MMMTDKVVAVVQARMGSTRLPNKMMLWLNGYPVIEWVRRRLENCAGLDDIVFAIPWTANNQPLAEYLWRENAHTYSGDPIDVLSRVTEAARITKADIVIRVCADNPFISREAVDPLVEYARKENAAEGKDLLYHWYLSTNGHNGWVDGLGAEAVGFETLMWAWRGSKQREHPLNWVKYQDHRETIIEPPEGLDYDFLKLDLDTYEDYQRLLASGVDIDMTAAEIVECFL